MKTFAICIPLLNAFALSLALPSHSQKICGKYGTQSVAGGEYAIQNNIWGAATSQCISPFGEVGFKVEASEHNAVTNGSPASYPSVWKGCHWEECTSDSGMPVQVRQIESASFSWKFSGVDSGSWNAAPEAWFETTSDSGTPDGTEMMWWLDSNGDLQPNGSHIGTVDLDGATWEVWYTNTGWDSFTYRRTSPVTSVTINMMPFINDAMSRGLLNPEWYLVAIEAGFEIWQGGAGLTSHSFSASVISREGEKDPSPDQVNPDSGASEQDSGPLCDWYGTFYPICENQSNGWGWENNKSCIEANACASQDGDGGVIEAP